MPKARIASDAAPEVELHYEIDDFTDPWKKPDVVLMMHGNLECSTSWYAWVPVLARHFKVIRPDMRGYGQSTPALPADYPWTIDLPIDDFINLMDQLGIDKFHLIAAKIGGFIARRFAARFPDRVLSLTVIGTPPPIYDTAARVESLTKDISENGIEPWARRTMTGRLGKNFPSDGVEWWIQMMARTPVSSQLCFVKNIPKADITADLPRIKCPTLVITTEGSALGSVDAMRKWQVMIPNSRLLVLPGDSYHAAASDADACAEATLKFIRQASAI
ncbi:MAG TPA: alpha/beta hydrolase [Burkholderiales bacterium]|nr:alpha/beta hydrolase [Burkholderiales bacterium]